MPLLPSLLQSTALSTPFLSTLVPSISLAYALQGLAAVPSILAHTEHYYDLSGSLTYLSCTALSLYLPALRAANASTAGKWTGAGTFVWPRVGTVVRGLNWRQVALSAAVGVWATRLGTYLYRRISVSGSDSRFATIRDSPPRFLTAFFLQATWVSICLLPVLAINAIPAPVLATLPRSVILTDALGLALFAGGLGFEVLADRQKDQWSQEKREKKHSEEFLTRGLWSKSRHPNYFGEVALWSGIAVVAGGVLARNAGAVGMGLAGAGANATGWKARALGVAMAGVSPAFVAALLMFVSGVPLSEKKYDAKFGHREDYQRWKRDTPLFVPKF